MPRPRPREFGEHRSSDLDSDENHESMEESLSESEEFSFNYTQDEITDSEVS